jgi:hypothetical protein
MAVDSRKARCSNLMVLCPSSYSYSDHFWNIVSHALLISALELSGQCFPQARLELGYCCYEMFYSFIYLCVFNYAVGNFGYNNWIMSNWLQKKMWQAVAVPWFELLSRQLYSALHANCAVEWMARLFYSGCPEFDSHLVCRVQAILTDLM